MEKQPARSWTHHFEHKNIMGILVVVIVYGLVKLDIPLWEGNVGTVAMEHLPFTFIHFMSFPFRCLFPHGDFRVLPTSWLGHCKGGQERWATQQTGRSLLHVYIYHIHVYIYIYIYISIHIYIYALPSSRWNMMESVWNQRFAGPKLLHIRLILWQRNKSITSNKYIR